MTMNTTATNTEVNVTAHVEVVYCVYDNHTGAKVGTYKTLKRATRTVDRLDNVYGGCRYGYRREYREFTYPVQVS